MFANHFLFLVPNALVACTDFIEKEAMVDGVYRISGIASNIKRLRSVKFFCVTLIDFLPLIKRVPQFLLRGNSSPWEGEGRERDTSIGQLKNIILNQTRFLFDYIFFCFSSSWSHYQWLHLELSHFWGACKYYHY